MSSDPTEDKPSRFALLAYPDDDSPPQIVGWGLALPDGSAFAVNLSGGRRTLLALCANADGVARLHNADVAWIDDEPSPPSPPHSPP
ncbi:hypothetical protein ABT235_20820 [Micromonospora echinofusca]|uniref:hypothetical protein n=1 Tax=Micromonospora echinofusca TaxID=47858 RepID=UPI000C70D226